jgi:hypothetical protein
MNRTTERTMAARLRHIDRALAELPPLMASAEAQMRALRAADGIAGTASSTDAILTLNEVAAFLRLTPSQMDDVAADLPAFELGGQLRVRRSRLLEWVAVREAAYRREQAYGTGAGALVIEYGKGAA